MSSPTSDSVRITPELSFRREFYQAFLNWNAVRSELRRTHYCILAYPLERVMDFGH